MTRIMTNLFLGSLRDAEELAVSNPHNIKAVITLCESWVVEKRHGLRYVHIPIEDDEPVPIFKFDRIVNAIGENRRRGAVLVHCGEGVSRAPSLTAAYMHVVGYLNIDSALAEIKRLRPYINPSDTLLESVRRRWA